MEKSSKRGKIPQSDWPLIMGRYEAGETLSSIARTYDCSPPAISYIVSRSRGKSANETAQQPATESQLLKTNGNGAVANNSAAVEPTVEPSSPVAEIRREPVTPRPTTSVNGDQRPKLHLSLGNGSVSGSANGSGSHEPLRNGNGAGNGHSHEAARQSFASPRPSSGGSQPQTGGERIEQRSSQVPPRAAIPLEPARNGRDLFSMPEARPAAQQPRDGEMARKDNTAFIDQELRSRVDGDIAVFLAAFDAALAADTQESRFGLREATDRLLRAGARTRIELERLEARVPLPPREGAGESSQAAWRYR
jgi:hypothetical protein